MVGVVGVVVGGLGEVVVGGDGDLGRVRGVVYVDDLVGFVVGVVCLFVSEVFVWMVFVIY